MRLSLPRAWLSAGWRLWAASSVIPGSAWPACSSTGRVLPNRYPLTGDVDDYRSDERSFGRILDYAVIGPRLQKLYDWSAA